MISPCDLNVDHGHTPSHGVVNSIFSIGVTNFVKNLFYSTFFTVFYFFHKIAFLTFFILRFNVFNIYDSTNSLSKCAQVYCSYTSWSFGQLGMRNLLKVSVENKHPSLYLYLWMTSYRNRAGLSAHIRTPILVEPILEAVNNSGVNHFLWQIVPVVHHSNAKGIHTSCHVDSWLIQFHAVTSRIVSTAGQMKELVPIDSFSTR
jgi:hypothetical protein